MSVSLMRYEPDYAVSPGDILQERLEAMSMNQAEFAKRCQISPQIINQIIHGRQRVTPEIAIIFEKITGVSAHIWNNLEASYRLHAPVQKQNVVRPNRIGLSTREVERIMHKTTRPRRHGERHQEFQPGERYSNGAPQSTLL